MNNQISNFNFPTDNSSSTNLKYDIISSKFATGFRNHQMRTEPSTSLGVTFGIISAVFQMILALLMMLIFAIRWAINKSK